MTSDQLQRRIEDNFPGSTVVVKDLTGTSDHYQVLVISDKFEGKSMIDQHRMVKTMLDKDIQSGELHALSLKTFTPAQWARNGG